MEGLFSNIGPVQRVRINYDRAGRSEGTATVTYQYLEDAKQAIREFDGANAKGQPIRLTLLPSGGRGGAGAGSLKTEKSKSLFDRIERPLADRTERSISPDGDGTAGGRRRRGGRGGRPGRSDTSKPAPDHIDRYVPGQQQSQRSPTRRGGQTGRRPGERRDDRRAGNRDGRRGANGGTGPRPKKTQEELDAEMDDYWGNTATAAATEGGAADTTATAGAAPAGNDDDIDMIE